jgi:nucleoside-diphosphate-sugar epimerase
MRVLVTGNRGLIGACLHGALQAEGHEVTGFDIAAGEDVRDLDQLRAAAQGCQAIVHLAALLGRPGEEPADIMAVNLLGTWNILTTAREVGANRVVYYSSVNALGIFMGLKPPDYLPIDDAHPCYPSTPYGISKRLAEEMCRDFTRSTGISTICLRPPGVFNEAIYHQIREAREADPASEWEPIWEYGAFLDVRDAADAARCALSSPVSGHVTALLCAEDISSAEGTSRDLARRIHPQVPWRGGTVYEDEPYKALIDTRRAREILGWIPQHRWRPSPAGRSSHGP